TCGYHKICIQISINCVNLCTTYPHLVDNSIYLWGNSSNPEKIICKIVRTYCGSRRYLLKAVDGDDCFVIKRIPILWIGVHKDKKLKGLNTWSSSFSRAE